VRFHPAGTASTLVVAARETAPFQESGWFRELVGERAAEFDRSAVAEVQAADIEEAMRQVTDALAVLRVVQRWRYPMVNVRSQTFGLPGQVTRATLDYLDLTATPGVGGRHVGAGTGWTFRDTDHDAWISEPPFRFLHEALIRSYQERTSLQRRALIAIDLFSQAWLSWQPDTALLSGVMALEVLLGDQADQAKKFRVARRASYFMCGWPNHRYSDGRPACPYLTHPLSSRGQPPALIFSGSLRL
jgi:hypothetical protein